MLSRFYPSAMRSLLLFLMLASVSASAATFTVTSISDSNAGSLRQAIGDAQASTDASSTIRFGSSIDGQIIELTGFSNNLGCVTSSATQCSNLSQRLGTEFGPSAFFITGNKTLTIDGLTGLTKGITIARSAGSGTAPFRLFDVDSGSTLHLIGLELANGLSKGGGAFQGGGALGAGGAIFSQGTLTLDRCTLTGNEALGGAAGLSADGDAGGGGTGMSSASYGGGGPNGGDGTFGYGADGGFGGGGGGGGNGGFGFGAPGGFGGGGGGNNGGGGGSFGGFGGGGGSNIVGGFGGGGGSAGGGGGGGSGMGGAIFNDAGNAMLVNSTLTANSAHGGGTGDSLAGNGYGYGGAIFNYNGTLSLNFTTISFNDAVAGSGGQTGSGGADGGAIYNLGDSALACSAGGNPCSTSGATMTMNNSIVSNSGGSPHDLVSKAINGGGNASSGSANLVMSQIGFGGTIVSTADPALSALANNGGTTLTMALQVGSQAIDAGTCTGILPPTDQRSYLRVSGKAPDLGAYEFGSISTTDKIFRNGFELLACP